MLGYGLPPEEIEKRLIRLRNLEHLHREQRLRNDALTLENRTLKADVARLNLVEKGYCASCKKWSTATPLPFHKVILGLNIQKYTCFSSWAKPRIS